jgi:hypothetical protein
VTWADLQFASRKQGWKQEKSVWALGDRNPLTQGCPGPTVNLGVYDPEFSSGTGILNLTREPDTESYYRGSSLMRKRTLPRTIVRP